MVAGFKFGAGRKLHPIETTLHRAAWEGPLQFAPELTFFLAEFHIVYCCHLFIEQIDITEFGSTS